MINSCPQLPGGGGSLLRCATPCAPRPRRAARPPTSARYSSTGRSACWQVLPAASPSRPGNPKQSWALVRTRMVARTDSRRCPPSPPPSGLKKRPAGGVGACKPDRLMILMEFYKPAVADPCQTTYVVDIILKKHFSSLGTAQV